MSGRPKPPRDLLDGEGWAAFAPAHDLAFWITENIILDTGPLYNDEHSHLEGAQLGVLWTVIPNKRQGRVVVGQAEIGQPRGTMGKWPMARAEQQIKEWFGGVPDFILTFDANYASQCTDEQFCAVVEHELYHCGQALDPFGQPKFTQDGRPSYAMRGHDVEEFVGVVRRYGVVTPDVAALVDAANQEPIIKRVEIEEACGTCWSRIA